MSQEENPNRDLDHLAERLPALMRRRQVGEVLGVSPASVDRLRREGKLDGVKTANRRYRYTSESVLRFLGWKGPVAVVLLFMFGYLALRIACAAGFDPAADALRFLQFGHAPSCVRNGGHHRGNLYAAAVVSAPTRFARLRIPGRRGRGRSRPFERDPSSLDPRYAATPPDNRSRAPP